LLDNAARPSGALVYAGAGGALLTDAQHERIKRVFAEEYQGAANAGRPLVLEGGLDWKPMALSPRDMDFLEAKHAAAREIAMAFGVPPMLLAIPGDNTYANYQEANRVFWRQSVLPLRVALPTRSPSGSRPHSAMGSQLRSIPIALMRSPPIALRCGSAWEKRRSSPLTRNGSRLVMA
jgi:hypothetical protein